MECPKCGRMATALFVVADKDGMPDDSPVQCDRCVLELQLPPGYTLKPDTRPMAPGRGPTVD